MIRWSWAPRAPWWLWACLLAAQPAPGWGSPLESVTQEPVRAWFDDDTLYVKYRWSYVRKAAFSVAIRGKVVETRSASFIITLPRAELSAVPKALRLTGGEPADNVEYQDRDFRVTRHEATLSVKGREATTDLDDCDMPYWWDQGLARTASGLLLCGAFVGASGRIEWRIPPETVRSLGDTLGAANQRGPGAVAKAFPALAATFGNDRLMITTDWTAVRPAEILVASIDPAHADAPSYTTSRMAAAAGYLGLQTARPVYSPSAGYVVNNGTRQNVSYALCDASTCTPLPLPTRCSYLLIDGPKRVGYCFEQANTSVSEVRITRIVW